MNTEIAIKYLNKVRSVRCLGGFRLRVVFADGYIGELDMKPAFENPQGPLLEPFRNLEYFQKVYVDGGATTWPNSYDICPDVLRYWCELGRVCSQAELDGAFLKDLPALKQTP